MALREGPDSNHEIISTMADPNLQHETDGGLQEVLVRNYRATGHQIRELIPGELYADDGDSIKRIPRKITARNNREISA